ncbi:hypothetical protein N657DRAFT_580330, partial [Parathielavia appendiculata]
KTYNTEDSPVVTDLSTSSAVGSLSWGEQTGSRILYRLWSYVLDTRGRTPDKLWVVRNSLVTSYFEEVGQAVISPLFSRAQCCPV